MVFFTTGLVPEPRPFDPLRVEIGGMLTCYIYIYIVTNPVLI